MTRRIILSHVFLLAALTGCTTVGVGHRTIVRARCQGPCDFLTTFYPQFVVPEALTDQDRILQIGPEEKPTPSGQGPAYEDFVNFLRLRYGSSDFRAVDLSFNHHDRTTTPGFFKADARSSLVTALSALFTADSKLTQQQRIDIQRLLEARLLNVPDLARITAPHSTELCGEGCSDDFAACRKRCTDEGRSSCEEACSAAGILYYYYPRISIDFSSSFRSIAPIDRLAYLGLVVRIKDERDGVRFLDFFPKDADLVEFSRGDFNQSAQLQAGANLGAKNTGSLTTGEAPLTNVTGTESSQGLSANATLSEGLASKLADAIERRSTGVIEDGRTFVVDLRSIRQVRIAGTYNFDLMLEVPSRLRREVHDHKAEDILRSVPVRREVVADVFLMGVVRHVYDRGHMGLIYKVPESENDDVFEEVVLKVFTDQVLWTAPAEPFFDQINFQTPQCKIKVLTNREDATFVVIDEERDTVLANGVGKEADISFPLSAASPQQCSADMPCCKAKVRFLPVVLATENGRSELLQAEERRGLQLIPDSTQTITGIYEPVPSRDKSH
jgi:hypothetical protein